jgi:hypothetical protein
VVRRKQPTKKRNSHVRTVVKADTLTATVTEGKDRHSAPWVVESPGLTVTAPACNDGKKRCLSAEGGSGNPRKRASEQNNTFTGASCKSGRRLSVSEIRAEAHESHKEIRDVARAAETAEEAVELEKLKGLAERGAARRASTGQAGKIKRAADEAKHWAATGQAGKDKRAGAEVARTASTGQAGKAKRVSLQAARKAATGQAGKAKCAAENATR